MVKLRSLNFWAIFIPTLLSLLMLVFIAVFAKFLPPRLPLFYSLPWGEQQLVNHSQLFILPAIITLVTLGNLIISWQLHPTHVFFKKILSIATLSVSTILTITFLKIVFIFI